MSLRKKVNLIIYRFRESGLEVFFVNNEKANTLNFPQGELAEQSPEDYITLDPVREEASGEQEEAFAVEGDWHEIPSLKTMLYQDAKQLKDKLKDIELGAFVSIKDALKDALPHQYAFLKELKDILRDRNSLRDL
ncbi:MAG: hypothetical protein ACRBG0_13435 [Lewinella sp.]|jgi:hypothetical protein|uniref:hypothetical protein n=1 Tax=Lewinella sp. TaxID=2004506 RepID=UPI003D6B636C